MYYYYGKVKKKKKGGGSIYLINIHERISCVCRRIPWHAGISAASILARCFERSMELIRALQLLKLNSVSSGMVSFFCHEHVLETSARLILGFTLCIVVLNLEISRALSDSRGLF